MKGRAYIIKYAIVYSSKTGNTAMLAEKIRECIPEGGAAFLGTPGAEACEADFIFAGFWTDKGSCDEQMAEFLRGLRNKRLFLFGTAGFGSAAEYFGQILARVAGEADQTNTIVGSYMCQGKMDVSVRRRYEGMAQSDPELRFWRISTARSHTPMPATWNDWRIR